MQAPVVFLGQSLPAQYRLQKAIDAANVLHNVILLRLVA
jgi:hypothetical protein